MKTRFTLPQSPTIGQFIVDKNGKIRKIISLPGEMKKFKERDIYGQMLGKFLVPLSFEANRYLNPRSGTALSPCPPELYVQAGHPGNMDNESIYLFSFSQWFSAAGKRYTLITLSPQTYTAPLVKTFATLYRSENTPVIFLDPDMRIISYNLLFLDMLNYVNEDAIADKPVTDLLPAEYKTANLFMSHKKVDYIKKTAARKGHEWKTIYNLLKDPLTDALLKEIFITNHAHVRCRSNRLVLERDDRETHRNPLVLLNKAVNFPEQDIEVDMQFANLSDNDVTIGFDHLFSGGTVSAKFELAYHFDLQIRDRFLFSFNRRMVEICTGSADMGRKNSRTKITLRRIGAQFTIDLNGVPAVCYNDTQPIFGPRASFISLYVYTKPLVIDAFTIKTRPTLFNIEEMEEKEPQLISFVSTPGKLFRFSTEPISYLNNKSVLAVRFYPVPILPSYNKKDYYLTYFEDAREYIQKNFFRRIDFRSLAKKCYMSYEYFITKFKAFFGASPKAYQTELRLREAQTLLDSKKFKIVEVYEMVGFDDASNFRKLFKKRFGCSLGEYGHQEQ